MKSPNMQVAVVVVCLMFAVAVAVPAQEGTKPSPTALATANARPAQSETIIPRLIKFSGTLLDEQGQALKGPVGVTFGLYAQQNGGAALWLETQNVKPDANGNYTILLGANSANGVPAELFASGEARWLGIQVGQQPEHERILLVSVPYALKAGDAETLGGLPASAFVTTRTTASAENSAGTASPTSPTTGRTPTTTGASAKTSATPQAVTTCSSVTSDGTATVNSIALFTTACNIESSLMSQATVNGFPSINLAGNNAGLLLSGTGTHEVTVTGSSSSGRLGQDATGFFFSSDTNGKVIKFLTNNGTLNERMRITSAGNVGIGTVSPSSALHVNGTVTAAAYNGALTLQPSVTDTSSPNCNGTGNCVSANVLAGYMGTTGGNTVTAGVTGATIAGGGGTIGGTPLGNSVTDDWGTVGGGLGNTAGNGTGTLSDGAWATVGGGARNTASGLQSAVGGGLFNTASGAQATVAGGRGNVASGDFSSVPGGTNNSASGQSSFAAGCLAIAKHDFSFVWNGGCVGSVSSSNIGQFVALAPGGVIFYSNTSLTAGIALAAGGSSWKMVSDRNLKRDFASLDGNELLAKINRMPMSTWSYKSQDSSIRHMGPMAQDFYAAFHLGEDDKHIEEIDGQGVALAAVQALYRLSLEGDRIIRSQQTEIQKLRAEVRELRRQQTSLASMEARLERLEARERSTRNASTRSGAALKKGAQTELARLSH